MYLPGFESWVELQKLPLEHEGAHRPGHFRGVSTVVSMLFNAVQPDAAVFGEKDFQQLRIIERMVSDLHFPIEIIRGPLIREADGLAMSSRNVRLSPDARQRALAISRGLFLAEKAFQAGERNGKILCGLVQEQLKGALDKVEYVHLVSEDTLTEVSEVSGACRLLVAAFVGGVRLIDNIQLR
jgi:pantoate--beta-alanine ligase